jgi:hypothetical protein
MKFSFFHTRHSASCLVRTLGLDCFASSSSRGGAKASIAGFWLASGSALLLGMAQNREPRRMPCLFAILRIASSSVIHIYKK